MNRILLTKEDNSKQEVDVIRYFKYKNDYFLIYTLNEYDEKDYIKLYVVKVLKELDEYIGYDIVDNDEWKNMQIVVKRVIKELKSNKRKNVQDLDFNEIPDIKVIEPRTFKLDKKLVKILMKNYIYSSEINNPNVMNNNSKMEDINFEQNDKEYEIMCKNLKEEKEASDLLIEDLINNLIEYKEKYGDIKSE